MAFFSPEAHYALRAIKRDSQLAAFPVLILLLFVGLFITDLWLWTHAGRFFAAHSLEALWLPAIVLPLAWTILAPLALLEAMVAIVVHHRGRGRLPTFWTTLGTVTKRFPRLMLWVTFEALGAAFFVALARGVGRITSIAGASAASYATTFVVAHLATTNATIKEALMASGQTLARSSDSLRIVTLGIAPGLLILSLLYLGTPLTLILTLSLAEKYPGVPTWLQNAAIASPIVLFIFLSLYAILAHFLYKSSVYERHAYGSASSPESPYPRDAPVPARGIPRR